jgi:hypothetical protein
MTILDGAATMPAPRMDPAFRPDDEALLARLEDAMVLGAVWERQTGAAGPPPPRAAGMIAALRARPGGAEAAARALDGDLAPILRLMTPERLGGEPPALLHHLAIHFGHVAERLAARDEDGADEARLRSIAAWLALAEERRYLEGFARRVAGGSLPAGEAEAAGRAAALRPLEDLGRTAREGARDRAAEAGRALASLARVHRAAQAAGLEGNAATSVARRADALRAGAIAAALAPALDAIAEATSRDTALRDAPAIFDGVRATWEWSGRDAQVERFAVDEATPLAWVAYRASGWEPLRALVAPLAPLVERMAQRCEEDPRRHLAYAAKCAQFLVFQAECETLEARRWPYVERALGICPTHRNARVVGCNILCDRAEVLLGGGALFQASAVAAAEQALARAELLWPQGRRLADVKKKLEGVRALRAGLPGTSAGREP